MQPQKGATIKPPVLLGPTQRILFPSSHRKMIDKHVNDRFFFRALELLPTPQGLDEDDCPTY